MLKPKLYYRSISPPHSAYTHLQHEGVWRVDEDRGVLSGRGLQTQLSVRGFRVIGKTDVAGQLPIVQHLLMMLSQMDIALRLELKRALWRHTKTEGVRKIHRIKEHRIESARGINQFMSN